MNRTTLFLVTAAGLAAIALVLGMPHVPGPTSNPLPTPDPKPIATASDGSLTLESRLSYPYLTPGVSDEFVTLDVTAARVAGEQRNPVSLALVIDRSGSMNGQKLDDAKAAARQLVRQLTDRDRLTLIHYGSDVRVLAGMNVDARNRERMLQFIDGIEDEGGTNIGDALGEARRQLLLTAREFKVNRVVLITDGQPTEGMTDSQDLIGVVKSLHAADVSLSAIGVGADFNEDLLRSFADYGGGSYGYLKDTSRLAELFQKDLQRSSTTVARDVEIAFELPEGVELTDVLGYPFSRSGNTVRVTMPDFFAGDVEHVVAQLKIAAQKPNQPMSIAHVRLDYSDLLQNERRIASNAQLAVQVTADQGVVAAKQDKGATVFATRAVSARNMEKAAEAFQRGDREEARREIAENQALFSNLSKVAGAPAVAADVQAQAQALDAMSSARSSDDVSHATKSLKKISIGNYGRNNAY